MDPKMRLQYCLNEFNTHEGLEGSRQALRKTFCVLDEWGPSHERMYLVGCYINEQLVAQAQSPPHLPLCICLRISVESPPHLLRISSASLAAPPAPQARGQSLMDAQMGAALAASKALGLDGDGARPGGGGGGGSSEASGSTDA